MHKCFNPRVPRGTRRTWGRLLPTGNVFQSPRPTRDATIALLIVSVAIFCFNPRVPRGTRPIIFSTRNDNEMVSIPASHAGRDRLYRGKYVRSVVSIPASHAGRDRLRDAIAIIRKRFNPRVPRGTRRFFILLILQWFVFQSPRPTRDATQVQKALKRLRVFQSPRPTRDATGKDAVTILQILGFNPRVPRGTRHDAGDGGCDDELVSIPASHAGRDLTFRAKCQP